MKAIVRTARRRSRRWTPIFLFLGGCLSGAKGSAQEEPALPVPDPDAAVTEDPVGEESPDLVNWVEFGFGGSWVIGNRAAFQQRQGLPEVFGGITAFHFEQPAGKDWLLALDGRGVFDSPDYAVRLSLEREDVGYVRVGYEQFRTWYDGSGGWLSLGDSWYELHDRELYTDRGEFWIEAGLTRPDLPHLEVGYHRRSRTGTQSSTIWGVARVPGLPLGQEQRGIVPAFLDLDEHRHLVRTDVTHWFGDTKVGLGVRYETGEIDNTRNTRQYPGQPGDAQLTTRDQTRDDLFNLHSYAETYLSDRVLFTVGYAYTDLNADHAGYRVYGTTYDPDLGQRLPHPGTYGNLAGTSFSRQHTGNLNLLVTLHDKLHLIPSFRVDRQDLTAFSRYRQPADPLSPAYEAESDRGFLELSENLELRYTGLTNWVLYARGQWMQGSGDLRENWNNLTSSATLLRRQTDDTRTAQKYAVGANWYPRRGLSLSSEYFHKTRSNHYDHPLDSTPNSLGSPVRYPAFLRAQRFDTDDVNFRVSLRPRSNLSLVARYDFQWTTLETRPDGRSGLQTSDLTGHVVSGGVSWVPLARVYLLGTVSYVHDRLETPTTTLTPGIADARNDYWTATATAGYALDDRTDLLAQFLYYRTDNYVDTALTGVPYGAGAEEHGVLVGLTRRLNARTRLGLNYGYFRYRDELSGHHLDHDAHVAYTTLNYRF